MLCGTCSCCALKGVGAATCDDGCVDCGKDGSCKDGSEWRVEITASSPATYECVCPPPPTPPPSVTPQPTTVCGDCEVCLKISKDQCKTGGGHDTQSECEAKGANYVWCGPA